MTPPVPEGREGWQKRWVEQTSGDLLGEAGAWLSPDGQHRYRLWREWDQSLPPVAFVMLNPSIADAFRPDPTMNRCVGFAKRWGYGRIDIINLWSFRSKDWSDVLACHEPCPRANNAAWSCVLAGTDDVVAAWGAHRPVIAKRHPNGFHPNLSHHARDLNVVCLGRSKGGEPRHPLMLPYETEREPWTSP